MASVEDKINNFIDMVFLEPNLLSVCETDFEDRVFVAIIQFKKKMLTFQLGIIAAVENSFFRYFRCIDLNAKCVESIAMDHCLSAYNVCPNIFLALMYSCSFLTTLADCCVRNGFPDFKKSSPALCKKIFGFVTRRSYSPDEWEKLLEFTTAPNLPEMIGLVKSCITGDNNLFTVQNIDRNCEIFGICDISALEKFQEISMDSYIASFSIGFSKELNMAEAYVIAVINSLLELKESLLSRLLKSTEEYSKIVYQI